MTASTSELLARLEEIQSDISGLRDEIDCKEDEEDEEAESAFSAFFEAINDLYKFDSTRQDGKVSFDQVKFERLLKDTTARAVQP